MTQNKPEDTLTDFHAVDYMREVRTRHADEYGDDQKRYVADAQKAMEAFRRLLKQPAANSALAKAGQTEEQSTEVR